MSMRSCIFYLFEVNEYKLSESLLSLPETYISWLCGVFFYSYRYYKKNQHIDIPPFYLKRIRNCLLPYECPWAKVLFFLVQKLILSPVATCSVEWRAVALIPATWTLYTVIPGSCSVCRETPYRTYISRSCLNILPPPLVWVITV